MLGLQAPRILLYSRAPFRDAIQWSPYIKYGATSCLHSERKQEEFLKKKTRL